MDRLAGAVQVLDELPDAVVVLERFPFAGAVVGDGDSHAAVEEGQFLQAVVQRGVVELGVGEDLRVGLERGLGAAFGGVADAADIGLGDAALVFLVIDVAVAADFDLAPFGEEVHDRDADAVQAAGGLVGAFVELAAELQHGHHAFERGDIAADLLGKLGVAFDGDAAAVVFDRDRAVDVDRHADGGGVAGHRFVDRVVDHFVDEVVQAAGGRVADVHAGPLADVLQVAEVLKILGRVAIAAARRSGLLFGLVLVLVFCGHFVRFCPVGSIPNGVYHGDTEGTERIQFCF